MIEVKISDILKDAEDVQQRSFHHLAEMVQDYYSEFASVHTHLLEEVESCESPFTVAEVETWICTDTLVGLFVVYYCGHPCAIRYKQGRKSETKYYYLESALYPMSDIMDTMMTKHRVEEYYPDESVYL